MIIRPAAKTEFTALPNVIFNDRRLSADTRLMLAWILSKSKTWQVRPGPLARALSRKGGKTLGRTKLSRMFREAMAVGYMTRSAQQGHEDDGRFGKYIYFVGMPDDVAEAVRQSEIQVLPCARNPHMGDPHTGDPSAANQTTNHKGKNLKTNNSKNPLPKPFPAEQAKISFGCPDEASAGAEQVQRRGRRLEGQEVIQNRIATRLGPRGWEILLALAPTEVDQLTASERAGRLGDDVLALLHARFPAELSAPTRGSQPGSDRRDRIERWHARRDRWHTALDELRASVEADQAAGEQPPPGDDWRAGSIEPDADKADGQCDGTAKPSAVQR
jgi:hypothetical protein